MKRAISRPLPIADHKTIVEIIRYQDLANGEILNNKKGWAYGRLVAREADSC